MTRVLLTCCGAAIVDENPTDGDFHGIQGTWHKGGGWITLGPCPHEPRVIVLPLDDEKEHKMNGAECWCEPRIDTTVEGKKIVVHTAKDGRPE